MRRNIGILLDCHQSFSNRQKGQRLSKVVTNLPFYRRSVLNNIFQGSIFFKPLGSCFLTAFRNAGHIINFVPHQCEVINNLFWRYTEFFLNPFNIEPSIFCTHRVNQNNVFRDKLSIVFVSGRYDDFTSRFSCRLRNCSDSVICFDTVNLNQRNTLLSNCIKNIGNLQLKIFGGFFSIGFIVRRNIGAEGFSFRVKNASHIVRRDISS